MARHPDRQSNDFGRYTLALMLLAALLGFYFYNKDDRVRNAVNEKAELVQEAVGYQKNLTVSEAIAAHPIHNRVQYYAEYLGDQDTRAAARKFSDLIEMTGDDVAHLRSELGEAYHQLGTIYLAEKNYPLAKKNLLQAVKLTQEEKGYNHPETGLAYHNLALAYWGINDYRSANVAFKHGEKIYEKTYSAGHSSLKQLRASAATMNISRQNAQNDSRYSTNELEKFLRKVD